MKLEPYLFYNGACEEALNFYAKAIGAKIPFIMRFKETPPDVLKAMPGLPENWGDKIMHACLQISDTQMLMASDTHESSCDGRPLSFNGFALSITAKDPGETKRLVDALAQGGKITMPVGPTFWGSPAFGMLEDRFGVSWMVSVETKPPA